MAYLFGAMAAELHGGFFCEEASGSSSGVAAHVYLVPRGWLVAVSLHTGRLRTGKRAVEHPHSFAVSSRGISRALCLTTAQQMSYSA